MASKIIKAFSGTGTRLPPMPTIRDVIRIYKLTALKQLSQNFLMDEGITARIVKAAGNIEGHYVLEVGPGPGSITRSIIRQCPKHLVVVEKDRRFMPTMKLLADAVSPKIPMDIYCANILNFPIETAFPDDLRCEWDGPLAPVHLIGNLPFAISTRLLINWIRDISLRQGAWIYGRSSMTLTFQKEVGERIVAPILDTQRCRLSVMSQIWTRPDFRFLISGRSFVPKPDVDVAVVRLIPLRKPMTDLPFHLVEKVVRYIFSLRQKYVRRGIQNLYPEEVRIEFTKQTFEEAQVDPRSRSFELSVEECLRLANVYSKIIAKYPKIDEYNYRGPKAERTLPFSITDDNYEDDAEVEDGDDNENDGDKTNTDSNDNIDSR